ncbi:hypothetical protein [Bacillus velezensis]|uniref:hypothetical protein n=1 Tax=Bacillus velezensis TaxID=492670 RepID=UPI004045DDD5
MHTLPSREKMPLTESIFIAAQKLIFTSRVVTGTAPNARKGEPESDSVMSMKLSADEVCLKKGGTAATTRPFSQGAGFFVF